MSSYPRPDHCTQRAYFADRAELARLVSQLHCAEDNLDLLGIVGITARLAELTKSIDAFEAVQDAKLERQKNAVLEQELQRRAQRLRAAEFEYQRAATEYRELRQELEG